jgi:hypothetical protein
MFIRFREMTARRYGGGERECAGKCQDRPRYYPRYGVGFHVKGRTFLQGCPMKPLCPLAKPRHRLEVSIVETRREGGKVKHKHVASLGSVWGDSPAAREAFWIECEARLVRLANRLGPDLDRLRQAIAARIPPLTDAEREAMKAAAWERLEQHWGGEIENQTKWIKESNEVIERHRIKRNIAEALLAEIKSTRGCEAARPLYDQLTLVLCAVNVFGWNPQRSAALEKIQAELKAVLDAEGRDGNCTLTEAPHGAAHGHRTPTDALNSFPHGSPEPSTLRGEFPK